MIVGRALLALLVAACVALPSAARAADPPAAGIGDQKPDTFRDQRLRDLGVRHARLVVPWDAVFRDPARLATWLHEARTAGMTPLLAFGAGVDARCPEDPCEAPSVEELATAFSAMRAAHPWVTEFETWNEANHRSQPTGDRPDLVAGYYGAMRARCPTCTIVAADVLGDWTMEPWLAELRNALTVPAALWGLHNWTDVTEGGTTATDRLLRAVGGEVWITETGGVVRFTTAQGHKWPYDEQRAARAIRFAWDTAVARADRIRRVYFYNWRAGPWERFDAGIINYDGTPRRPYAALVDVLRPGTAIDWTPSATPGRPPAADPVAPVVPAVVPARARVSRHATLRRGRVVLRVHCDAGEACSGSLTLTQARRGHVRRLGTAVFAIRGGGARLVRVRVDPAGRAALRRSPRVRADLALRSATGALARRRAQVVLRPR